MLLAKAIWTLLEAPRLAQLLAQLLLVGLLHGLDGCRQGRGKEGSWAEGSATVSPTFSKAPQVPCRQKQRTLDQAISGPERLWVRC